MTNINIANETPAATLKELSESEKRAAKKLIKKTGIAILGAAAALTAAIVIANKMDAEIPLED